MELHRRDAVIGIGSAGAATLIGSSGIVAADGASGAPDDQAAVRVVHASPDAPNVDVFVEGDEVLSDVAFGDVSAYLRVAPGTYTVKITAAGDPGTVAFEGDLTLEAKDYTVAALGELSEGTFAPKILADDGDAAGDDEAAVRVVHAAPDAPAVDVTIDDAATTLVDGAAFQDATGYLTVDPGHYELEVRPDSEANDNPFAARFPVDLEHETTYTAFAIGYFTRDDEPADEKFRLLPAVDGAPEPERARVRVAHASPDAPNVDVYVDGSRVLADVPFTAVSDYLHLEPGTYTVKLTAAGDESTVAFEGDLELAAEDYTVAAIGELTEETFEPLVLQDDNSELGDDRARVRVVHASPDAPAVDVTYRGGRTAFNHLAFGEAQTKQARVSTVGDETFKIREDSWFGTGEVLANLGKLPLEAGKVYTLFAEGYLSPDDEPTDEGFRVVTSVVDAVDD